MAAEPNRDAPAGAVQSVSRALDILEAVDAAGPPMSLRDLALDLGLAPPTVHRIARTLVARGYLRQQADRRYCLGSRLVSLGTRATSVLGERALPVLRGLADLTGESANLAVLAGERAEYVSQVPGSHAMRIFTEVGRRVPLHCTGVGKALLSLLADDHVTHLLRATPMAPTTPATITTPERMHRELDAIRARGYAIDDEEMETGVRCIAAPVRADSLIAVSISGPAVRMTPELIALAAPALLEAGRELATQLNDRAQPG